MFLGIGVALYFSLKVEPPRYAGVLLLTLCVAGGLTSIGPLPKAVRTVIIALVLIATGFTLAQSRAWSVTGNIVSEEKRPRDVTGQVVRVSHLLPAGYKIWLKPSHIERSDPSSLPTFLKVTIRSGKTVIAPGDWISFLGILGPPPKPVSPGAFDFRRMYWFDSIGGVGFAVSRVNHIDAQHPNNMFEATGLFFARYRAGITNRIQRALPKEEGAVAAALLTGDRAAIPKEHLQALRDSGLAHLLAISGLHMGLAGFGIFLAVRFLLSLSAPLALTYPIKKWAAGTAFIGILFYLICSGMAVSAQRAFIMTGIVFTAIMLDRAAITLRTVALAAVAIILVSPEVVVEAGFQMSFSAVICLVAAYEHIRANNFLGTTHGEKSYLSRFFLYGAGIVVTSLIASLATAPMAAYHFNRVAHYSVLADFVAMPVMAFVVMPSAILSFLLMPLGLEAMPLQIMGWGIRQILAVGHYVSSIPGAVSGVASWPPLAFAAIVLGGLWLCLWRQKWRICGVPMIALGVVIGTFTDQPDILISDDGRQILYRTNDGSMTAFDPRRRRFEAEAWLRREGDLRPLSSASQHEEPGKACDAMGCVAQLDANFLLAISKDTGSVQEDCMHADIVVSDRPIRQRCRGPKLVVDRFDLWRNGSYAIWFKGDRIIFETNRHSQGKRPWTQPVR